MPRGGAREGAGRKPRLKRYQRQQSIGGQALAIGQRCEVLWRESYEPDEADKPYKNFAGMHWEGAKRPWARRRSIIKRVAREFGETERTVRTCWDDYRQLESDLDEDV